MVGVAGCQPGRQRDDVSSQPDLVLLIVGGLRADPPSGFGGSAALLEAFDLEWTWRSRAAYAQSLSPFISLGAMLTGRYSSAIPLCGPYRGLEDGDERAWCAHLPADVPSLPEVLGYYGYRSALFTSELSGADFLGRGFERVESLAPDPKGQTRWASLRRQVRRWWSSAASARLLVVYVSDLQVDARPALQRSLSLPRRDGQQPLAPILAGYRQEAAEVGVELAGLWKDLHADRHVMLVVSSTNGMSLGEIFGPSDADDDQIWRQLSGAASNVLLDRTARVPLAVFSDLALEWDIPKEEPVELVDLLPTFTSVTGAVPPAGIAGDALHGGHGGAVAAPFAHVEFGDMLALRQASLLLSFRCYLHDRPSLDPEVTERLLNESVEAERYALHDVWRDPSQQEDLLHEQWGAAMELRAQLVELKTGPLASPPRALNSEEVRQLRLSPSEGYW